MLFKPDVEYIMSGWDDPEKFPIHLGPNIDAQWVRDFILNVYKVGNYFLHGGSWKGPSNLSFTSLSSVERHIGPGARVSSHIRMTFVRADGVYHVHLSDEYLPDTRRNTLEYTTPSGNYTVLGLSKIPEFVESIPISKLTREMCPLYFGVPILEEFAKYVLSGGDLKKGLLL